MIIINQDPLGNSVKNVHENQSEEDIDTGNYEEEFIRAMENIMALAPVLIYTDPHWVTFC